MPGSPPGPVPREAVVKGLCFHIRGGWDQMKPRERESWRCSLAGRALPSLRTPGIIAPRSSRGGSGPGAGSPEPGGLNPEPGARSRLPALPRGERWARPPATRRCPPGPSSWEQIALTDPDIQGRAVMKLISRERLLCCEGNGKALRIGRREGRAFVGGLGDAAAMGSAPIGRRGT